MKLLAAVHRFRHAGGQDLIEYALLTGGISLLIFALVQSIGTDVNTRYATVSTALSSSGSSGSGQGNGQGQGNGNGNAIGQGNGNSNGYGNGNGNGNGNGRGGGG